MTEWYLIVKNRDDFCQGKQSGLSKRVFQIVLVSLRFSIPENSTYG